MGRIRESQKRATAKFEKENYFKVTVRLKKCDEERIRQAAEDSLNGFIVRCVMEKVNEIVPMIKENAEISVRTGIQQVQEDDTKIESIHKPLPTSSQYENIAFQMFGHAPKKIEEVQAVINAINQAKIVKKERESVQKQELDEKEKERKKYEMLHMLQALKSGENLEDPGREAKRGLIISQERLENPEIF